MKAWKKFMTGAAISTMLFAGGCSLLLKVPVPLVALGNGSTSSSRDGPSSILQELPVRIFLEFKGISRNMSN